MEGGAVKSCQEGVGAALAVAAALRRLAKTRLGRTAPAQLALPASPRYCTELRPSQGRTLGQNKLIKCRERQVRQCLESQNPVNTRNYTLSHLRSLAMQSSRGGCGWRWVECAAALGRRRAAVAPDGGRVHFSSCSTQRDSRQIRANCRGKSCKAAPKPDPRQNSSRRAAPAEFALAVLKFTSEGEDRGEGGVGSFLRFFSGFSDTVTFVKEGHKAHIMKCTMLIGNGAGQIVTHV